MFKSYLRKVQLIVVLSAMIVMSISTVVLATDTTSPVQDISEVQTTPPAIEVQTTPPAIEVQTTPPAIEVQTTPPALTVQALTTLTAAPTIEIHPGDIVIDSVEKLNDAIKNQAKGQTWVILPGNYGLTPINDYTAGGQTGWYFPITADDLTIKGDGMPVIYGDAYTPNGIWSSQNLVTVFGNNVKIDGICFMPKVEVNKTIEVTGSDFEITNCTFTANTKTSALNGGTAPSNGGALYFSGPKGVVTVKNNTFSATPVVFDSMTAGTAVVVESNTFDNISADYYAVGNVTWASPPALSMADVTVKNNNFIVTGNECIIKNRVNGSFNLTGNKINGAAVNNDDWGKYITLQNNRYTTPPDVTNPKVVVDGQEYNATNNVRIANVTDLQNAIKNQADGQTWLILPGDYSLNPINDYIARGQSGWYFPITANHLTIVGVGMPVIYGNQFTQNGNWSTQNLVTIFGDNVTLKGLDLMTKVEGNKTIEIVGADSRIENCTIEPNTKVDVSVFNSLPAADREFNKQWGGSLYFSAAGNHVVKDVTVKNAGISFRYSPAGTHINFENVNIINNTTVDDINSYRYSSGFNNTDCTTTGSLILTYAVDTTKNNFDAAIKFAKAGDIINVAAGTYNAPQFLVAAEKAGITIKGAGVDQTVFALAAAFDGFKVQAHNVTLKDFTIDGTNTANYGLRAQGVDNLTVQNVKITKMKKSAFDVNGVSNSNYSGIIATNNGGYGISINQSKDVIFAGNTSSNTWGAINIANKPQPFTNIETSGIDITNVVTTESNKLSIENYNPGNAGATTLSGLSISTGTLGQTFSPSVYNYTASVPNSVSNITITAAITSAVYKNMSFKVNLAEGQNAFAIKVLASNDAILNTYTLTVTRNQVPPPPSTDTGDSNDNSGGSSNPSGGTSGGSSTDNQAIDEINEIINTGFLAGQSDNDTANAIGDAITKIDKIDDPATAVNQTVLVIRGVEEAAGAAGHSEAVENQIQALVNTAMGKVNSQSVNAMVTGDQLKADFSQDSLKSLEAKMAQIVSTANKLSAELAKVNSAVTVEKVLKLDVVTSSSASKSTVGFPSTVFNSAAAAGIDKISINTGVANIAIELGTFTGTGTVELSAKKLNSTELSDAVKAQVQNNPVYDFTMLVGTNKVSSFNKQVEVSIPYSLAQGANPDSITVYYISDSGELVNVSGVYDAATKTVKFSTNHFSVYMVKQNPVVFKDLVKFEWAKKSVEFLAAKGIIKGISKDIFKPDDKITKSQIISLITRSLKLSATVPAKSFKDLKKGNWYYNDMITAVNMQLISGDKDGNLLPEKSASRQEMAVIIGKLLVSYKHKALVADADADTILGGFVDKKLISEDAKKYTAMSIKYGILEGISDGLFGPAETMTRAQAAVVIYRLFNMD